jgi:mannose-1-phosphate guanylyltransferase/phosphomannomutase
MATIVLTRVPQPLQYGIVMTNEDGRITRFLEKPSWGEVFSDTINTGIYILEPEVLDLIPARTEFDFSKDLYPLMLRKELPLYGYVAQGYWKDIGNLAEYQLAHADVLDERVKLELPGELCDSAYCGTNLELDPSAHLSGMVILGNNVRIGADAYLHNCVIGNNVSVGARARLVGSVVWDNCTIGEGVELSNDVICNHVQLGNQVSLLDNVIVAEECVIGEGARILSNIKLWPRKTVESDAVVTRSLVREERWSRELFTEARISGLSNIDLNPEFGAKFGAALGTALGSGNLVVASRDDDEVSRIMKRSITAGLMSVGVSVSDLQTTSVPQTRQEMNTGRYVAGFHVRRSPRHVDQTDIIMFGKDGRDIPLAQTKSIDRFYYGEDIRRVAPEKVGRLGFPERSTSVYVDRVLSMINRDLILQRRFQILVDYSYGLAANVMPQILGELKVRVLAMNNYVDATHFADPLQPSLNESGAIMRSLGYELGIKIDPGAERLLLIDERGISYQSQRLLTMMTKLFVDTHVDREPYVIAVPVQATQEIEQVVEGHQIEVRRIRSSHGGMMDATRDENVLFVGGTRGGFIFPEFLSASDGMFTACRILEMVAQTQYSLSDLDRTLPKRHQFTNSIPCPWENKGTVMRRAMEHSEGKQRLLVDGVKIHDGSASVLLVPDREDAQFLVTAEADTQDAAQRELERYTALVTQWRDGN